MKLILHAVAVVSLLLGSRATLIAQALPVPVPAPVADSAPAPKIAFDNAVWDFGRIKSGEVLKHTFVFTNTGTATLEITQVQPGCGCTTAGEWTRKVEPEETGTLAIQFNSANFQGPVLKTVAVHSNDKSQPNVMLQLKGTIWKAVDVNPQFAMINVLPDSPSASTIVQILNNSDEPLVLSNPDSNNPLFHATIITNRPGKEFQLVIAAEPASMTNTTMQGQITLKTSMASTPVITVTAWANVQQAIVTMPPQVVLPTAPLAAPAAPEVTIQNNSTNLVQITDVNVNLPGVEVALSEKIPGRSFIIKLSFPVGFQMAPGQQGVVTARSSSSQMPSIKIPIHQTPRPVVSVPPTPPGSGQQ